MEDFEVLRVDGDGARTILDLVAEEVPVTIIAGGQEIATLLASPTNLEELAVGFLFSSGLVEDASGIGAVTVDTRAWAVSVALSGDPISPDAVNRRLFASGCGRGVLFYRSGDIAHTAGPRGGISVRPEDILRLMNEFQSASPEYQDTGGVHSAALATAAEILVCREDIGRHNAVDKVLGYALRAGMDLADKILLSSGRISSEIVLKLRKTATPVLVSRSAPTNQAVLHARGADMTLIGFARGRRFNVYSGERRISRGGASADSTGNAANAADKSTPRAK